MASAPPKSQFLALPLELRTYIYQELLAPHPEEIYTLYHDRSARSRPFDFHPVVLRLCRQTNTEAVSILYECNTFKIHISTPAIVQCPEEPHSDHVPNHHHLFRCDSTPDTSASEKQASAVASGLIYPHCFHRLQRIVLHLTRVPIWYEIDNDDGPAFSQSGELILTILCKMAYGGQSSAPSPSQKMKSLEIVGRQGWYEFLIFVREFGRKTRKVEEGEEEEGAESSDEVVAMLALLGEIQRNRRYWKSRIMSSFVSVNIHCIGKAE
ncbi:hypothetical protein MMC12_007969 [Toensbergia leucococca]|nr:hypothetical protein [Toensbergia leucococca]